MPSDELDMIQSLGEQQRDEDKAWSAHLLKERDAIIKEAVQKVIEGLSIELDTEMNESFRSGLKVSIRFDGDEVASSWVSLNQLK